jgi:hypothetical protein
MASFAGIRNISAASSSYLQMWVQTLYTQTSGVWSSSTEYHVLLKMGADVHRCAVYQANSVPSAVVSAMSNPWLLFSWTIDANGQCGSMIAWIAGSQYMWPINNDSSWKYDAFVNSGQSGSISGTMAGFRDNPDPRWVLRLQGTGDENSQINYTDLRYPAPDVMLQTSWVPSAPASPGAQAIWSIVRANPRAQFNAWWDQNMRITGMYVWVDSRWEL